MLDLALHVQLAGKLRRIRDGDLDEDHVVRVSEVIVAAYLAQLVAVVGPLPPIGFLGNEPDRAAGGVADEELRGWVECDAGGAQFEGACEPGGQGNRDDRSNEDCGK